MRKGTRWNLTIKRGLFYSKFRRPVIASRRRAGAADDSTWETRISRQKSNADFYVTKILGKLALCLVSQHLLKKRNKSTLWFQRSAHSSYVVCLHHSINGPRARLLSNRTWKPSTLRRAELWEIKNQPRSSLYNSPKRQFEFAVLPGVYTPAQSKRCELWFRIRNLRQYYTTFALLRI